MVQQVAVRPIKLPCCMLFWWMVIFVVIGIFISILNICVDIHILYKLLINIVVILISFNEFYNTLMEKIIYENRPIQPRNNSRHH